MKVDASQAEDPKAARSRSSAGSGLARLLGAAALFTLCTLVQKRYGSSMFDTSYVDPGFVGGLLLNVTFWPGWFGTGALASALHG